MALHPDRGDLSYQAVTFASPGALIPTGADARVVNYEIGADPIAFGGLHRQEIALAIKQDQTGQLHDEFVAKIQDAGIPLTESQIDKAFRLAIADGDYLNRGETIYLDSSPPITSVDGLLKADVSVHDIDVYAPLAAQARDLAITAPPVDHSPAHEAAEAYMAVHFAQVEALGGTLWGTGASFV